jgi:putative redox protein
LTVNRRHEEVTFDGVETRLSGSLQIPDGDIRGGVVLAHCFTCSRSYKVIRNLATGIEDGGYAVLRFDFTGLGESDGDFAETSLTTNVGDLEAATRYMQLRGFGSCALVGHSLGGAAALLAARESPEIRAVATVAAPSTAEHVRHLFDEDDIETALSSGRVHVKIAGRPFEISAEFFKDLGRQSTLDHITNLRRPLLVVHGTADQVIGIEESEKVFSAARQPRWFAAIPDANHLFTRHEHAERAAGAIVAFLRAVI